MAAIIDGIAGQTNSSRGSSFSRTRQQQRLSVERGSLIISALVVGIVAMLTAGCGGGNMGTASRNVAATQPPITAPVTPLDPSPSPTPTPTAPGGSVQHDRITVTVVCPAPDIPEKK